MSTTVDSPAKSMKGKYDGRKRNRIRKALPENGARPNWVKHLSRKESDRALRELDSIATVASIYRLAMDGGRLALAWQIRQDVENRLYGKPYTAVNPDEMPRPNVMIDARVQTAIDKYVAAPKMLTQAAEKAGGGQGN